MTRSLLVGVLFFISSIVFSQTTYTFNGNGNWSDSSNWANRLVPPNELPAGSSIHINPKNNGQCFLDVPQIILNGSVLNVMSGAKFVLLSDLINDGDSTGNPQLTLEGVEHLDTCGVPPPTDEEMSAVNGVLPSTTGKPLGVQETNDVLIKNMLDYAKTLIVQKETISHAAGTSINPDGTLVEPFHKGFAYRFSNNKELNARHFGLEGDALHRSYAVYGTDCTGFLINLLKHEQINIRITDVIGFEAALNTALSNHAIYGHLAVKKYPALSKDLLKDGDFILWTTNGNKHDGIIKILPNGKVDIFNSNGTNIPLSPGWRIKPDPNSNPPKPGVRRTPHEEQDLNLGEGRGIHTLSYEKVTNTRAGYWGTDYHILRIQSKDISGQWQRSNDNLIFTITQDVDTINISGSSPWFDHYGDAIISRGSFVGKMLRVNKENHCETWLGIEVIPQPNNQITINISGLDNNCDLTTSYRESYVYAKL